MRVSNATKHTPAGQPTANAETKNSENVLSLVWNKIGALVSSIFNALKAIVRVFSRSANDEKANTLNSSSNMLKTKLSSVCDWFSTHKILTLGSSFAVLAVLANRYYFGIDTCQYRAVSILPYVCNPTQVGDNQVTTAATA